MIERALEIALALEQRFEGCILSPYLCPAGIATIGYGSTQYEDGRIVMLTDAAISKDRAFELLVWTTRNIYLPTVLELCPNIDSSTRLAALVDFTYNLGGSRLKNSTLRRRVNSAEWSSVPTELRKWIYGGGRKLNGLILRRDAEAALI